MTNQLYRIRVTWREWCEERARRRLHRSEHYRTMIRRLDDARATAQRRRIAEQVEQLNATLTRGRVRVVEGERKC
jgi:hypothetical protein